MKIRLAEISWNSPRFSHGKGVSWDGSIPLANGLVELAAHRFARSLVRSFVRSLVRFGAQLQAIGPRLLDAHTLAKSTTRYQWLGIHNCGQFPKSFTDRPLLVKN